ncbi:MAG: hypothetical protein JWM33_2007, partial [Caulobacteraceae bacterium]|nr:hypothetical protein [Caulobacteraceae bacterium]
VEKGQAPESLPTTHPTFKTVARLP